MGGKYFRTKCYWFNEYQDMNAIVPTCDYYKQYGSCPCSDECEHYISEQEVEKIIRKRVENEWIPCSERLPEEGERVLATHLGGVNPNRQVIEHIYQCGEFTCGWDMDMNVGSPTFGQRYMGKVIAWMPLPESYREDGKKE